ncbi:MAG: DNA polymerase III subunit delta', partial [Alphaproteobacteria bacterium]
MTSSDTPETHPRRTAGLLGHEAAEATILQLWQANRLPHAVLLSGPRGIGKATLAYRIARFILANGVHAAQEPSLFGDIAPPPDSLHIGEDDPVFARVASGGHADLLAIERSVNPDTGRPRRDIVVDDIRKVTGLIRHTAAEGGWRIVIVDSADDMNQNAANALLKMLEEPPPNVLFLLVNHAPGGLLPTIRSRCRRLALSALPPDIFQRLLTELRPAVDSPDDRAVIAYL